MLRGPGRGSAQYAPGERLCQDDDSFID